MLYRLAVVFVSALALTSCNSGYKKVTVVKMASIFTPSNLLDTAECRQLWGDVQRFGLEMDEAREDWNQIVLNNAFQLIERGCVKQRARE